MRYYLLFLSLGAALALPVAAQQRPAPGATYYRLYEADCAIFPATVLLDTLALLGQPLRFTPTRQQVEIAEKQLKAGGIRASRTPVNSYDAVSMKYIQKHLPDYKRQYFGYYNAQHQPCFFIQFLQGDFAGWLSGHLLILDGGTSVCEIQYNLVTRQFYGLGCHSKG